jgi:hypothetical protein
MSGTWTYNLETTPVPAHSIAPMQGYQANASNWHHSQRFSPYQYQPSPNYGMPPYGNNMVPQNGYGMGYTAANMPRTQPYVVSGNMWPSWLGPCPTPFMSNGPHGSCALSQYDLQRLNLCTNFDQPLELVRGRNNGNQQIPGSEVIEATAQQAISQSTSADVGGQVTSHHTGLDNGEYTIPAPAISAMRQPEAEGSGLVQSAVTNEVDQEDTTLDDIVWPVCDNHIATSEVSRISGPAPPSVTVGRSWASSPTTATESVGWRSKKGLSTYTRRVQEKHILDR